MKEITSIGQEHSIFCNQRTFFAPFPLHTRLSGRGFHSRLDVLPEHGIKSKRQHFMLMQVAPTDSYRLLKIHFVFSNVKETSLFLGHIFRTSPHRRITTFYVCFLSILHLKYAYRYQHRGFSLFVHFILLGIQ